MKNMKRTILLAVGIAMATSANAQTIALHSSAGVQLFKGNTALSDACTAAQHLDTLYLSGGSFTPPVAFDKRLMVFGAGHHLDSTLATGRTFINGNVTLHENADHFYLEGVEVTGSFTFSYDHSINNVTIKRCKINGLLSISGTPSNQCQNVALIGNIFTHAVYLNNATNSTVSNCIIQLNIAWSVGNLISNNIILLPSAYSLHDSHNNTVSNNIFLGGSITEGAGNIYSNNLIASASPYYGATPTVFNTYANVDQQDIFVNQTGHSFDYAHDYHLQSPLTYVGTDNTQVGIYGGTFPYKEGAVPSNPHIQVKNIAATTDANGNLQIQIRVEAQED